MFFSKNSLDMYLVNLEADGVFLIPLRILCEGDDHWTPGLGVVRVGVVQAEHELRVPHEVTWDKEISV